MANFFDQVDTAKLSMNHDSLDALCGSVMSAGNKADADFALAEMEGINLTESDPSGHNQDPTLRAPASKGDGASSDVDARWVYGAVGGALLLRLRYLVG